jgi:hypothetical protein
LDTSRRDELRESLLSFDERHLNDCAEAVTLQFKEIVGIIERLRCLTEPYRANAWQHA